VTRAIQPPPLHAFASRSIRALATRVRIASADAPVLFSRLARAALPNLCALCGNMSQQTICAGCDNAYWNEPRMRCVSCALPLAASRRRAARPAHYRCGDCATSPPSFDATLALADYRAPLDGLALGLKFHARLALAREFAARLARLAADHVGADERPDTIAPVPLARRRLIERGFNQAWEIAKPLARAFAVRAEPTLVARVADTAPQSRLDLEARRHNVETAFAVVRPVRGLHVAVVDDVMTSGATLDALARTLKAAGARRVTNFVALRTPRN
jgi:ComF family protein